MVKEKLRLSEQGNPSVTIMHGMSANQLNFTVVINALPRTYVMLKAILTEYNKGDLRIVYKLIRQIQSRFGFIIDFLELEEGKYNILILVVKEKLTKG